MVFERPSCVTLHLLLLLDAPAGSFEPLSDGGSAEAMLVASSK